MGAPLALLGLAEGLLRLGGYGWPTGFFIRTPDGDAWMTNPRFGWSTMARASATQPTPVRLALEKPPGTRRVFVLGESAAAGTPEPAFGLARMLGWMLERQYPGQRIEVVNAAMRGVNSHALTAIARDCARFSPDAFVVYAGNNERIGLHAPEPGAWNRAAWPRLLRIRQAAVELKLGQWILGSLGDARQPDLGARPRETDMAFFRGKRLHPDDPRTRAVDANFQANLGTLCAVARQAGARTVLSTVAANLSDFAPLGSLNRPPATAADADRIRGILARGDALVRGGNAAEAGAAYREALGIDAGFADSQFRLGQWLRTRGPAATAREPLALARDLDALPFRTDRRLNAIIRETAARESSRGVALVDAEGAFAADAEAAGEGGSSGARLFRDHVHFTFAGDYLLARSLAPAVAEALGLGAAAGPVPSIQECANALAFTEWDAIGLDAAILRMTARPPFLDQLGHAERQKAGEDSIQRRTAAFQRAGGPSQVTAIYRAALARRPDDWQIRSLFATALEDFGQPAAALEQLEAAARLMPVSARLRVEYGQALFRGGRNTEALAQLEQALRLEPSHASAREGLEVLRGARRP